MSSGGLKVRSVKHNVVMNMILTTSSFLFPLISAPYVNRVLSTTGTGAVSFAQNISQYFSLVAVMGMGTYGAKACARVRNNPDELATTTKEILVLLGITTSLVTAVYFASILVVPQFSAERLLFTLFAGYIWLVSLGVEWFYQALEQYRYITFRSVAFKLLSLILMFLFVRQRSDYIVYGAIVIFASGASNILNIIRLGRIIDLKTPRKLDVFRHIKLVKWYAIASISSGMYTHVDLVMLGFLGTPHMVGLYQLVSKIKTVLVSGVNSVGNVMLPRLSHYQAQGDDAAARQLMSKSVNFVMITGFAIIALLSLCAVPVVQIMGGDDFLESALPLTLVTPAVMFSALNTVLANYMISSGLESKWATVNFIGLIIATLVNMILIPQFGVVGAAVSITVCEGLMLIMRTFICRDFVKALIRQTDPMKIVVSAVISLGLAYVAVLFFSPENEFVFILLAGFVYSISYLVSLLVLKETLVMDLLGQMIK